MAGRTGITGDQVEDDSLTGDDVEDGSMLKADLSAAVQAEINANTAKVSDINHVQLELPNVDNTSDVDKPVSTAQAAANTADRARANHTGTQLASTISDFEAAHDTLPSDNPHSVTKAQVGLGNADNTSDADKPVSTAGQTALDLKTDKATLTTKGDIYARNLTEPTRLGIGADTFALVADAVSAVGMAWKQLLSAWVFFDPTGLPAFIGDEDNVNKALRTLGNQTIEDLAEIEGFDSAGLETTISNGWVSKTGFPWTSSTKSAGLYSVRWFYEVGQTKAARNFGYRTEVTAPSSQILTEIPISGVANDGQLLQQGGFQEFALLADGPITVDVQFGQTTNGFSAIMNNAVVEIRRTGDLP